MAQFKSLLGESWYNQLEEFIQSDSLSSIAKRVNFKRRKATVIPESGSPLMFTAFRETPYNKVKVVILGQDPYHSMENGHYVFDGLAFSNAGSMKPQPSLRNILTEVERDMYDEVKIDRVVKLSLYDWARQGVLLVNTAHTVEKGNPGSHLALWKPFTLEVIKKLNEKNDIVWLLWGGKAIAYKEYISNPSHTTICTSHPSPLGATKGVQGYPAFVKSGCFSKVNEELEVRNIKKIHW